jgi:hypothetical protein
VELRWFVYGVFTLYQNVAIQLGPRNPDCGHVRKEPGNCQRMNGHLRFSARAARIMLGRTLLPKIRLRRAE